jgi:transcriptional regulator with XRE-family HTH domain
MTTKRPRFGPWLKIRRIEAGYTLRAFALETGVDAGNLSKYERSVLPPPQDLDTLGAFAAVLKIRRGSAPWHEMVDLAAVEGGRIPRDLADDPKAAERLPLLFRVARKEDLTEKELTALAELVRRS